jgi:hypothetical protein
MSFIAYGTRFGVRVNDPAVLERIPERLPLGWKPDSSPSVDFLYSLLVGETSSRKGVRHYNLLYAGSGRLARTLDLEQLLASFEEHLELTTALLARDCLFVHAGVVGWQGQAIVIPGRGFSGKTTLVAALVQAGATYYSDEYAIFDPQGRVHSYSRPLSFRDASGQKLENVPVEELGGRDGGEPLPVGLVVVTEYEDGARWRPRTMTPGRAMLALMDNTIAARQNPELSMPILKQVVSGATTIRSKRGEAAAVVESLLGLVEKNSVAVQ